MSRYEEFVLQLGNEGIIVYECRLPCDLSAFTARRTADQKPAIFIAKNLRSDAERLSVLLEELGHIRTSSGNLFKASDDEYARQEHRARAWAITHAVLLDKLLRAADAGIHDRGELAEALGIGTGFLVEVLRFYQTKIGY